MSYFVDASDIISRLDDKNLQSGRCGFLLLAGELASPIDVHLARSLLERFQTILPRASHPEQEYGTALS